MSSNVPHEYFQKAVEKSIKLFIESSENVKKFPVRFSDSQTRLICDVAVAQNLTWKLVGPVLLLIKDVNLFPDLKIDLRPRSFELIAKTVELVECENKENSSPSFLSAESHTLTNSPRRRSNNLNNFVSTIPPSSKKLNYSNLLQISKHESQILNVFHNNQIFVVEGAAGCGKSTQIPQLILEDCAERKNYCHILVATTERICAVASAERVSFERQEALGTTVGYKIDLESKVAPTSNLIYTTADVILNSFKDTEPNDFFKEVTTLIIDEFQEREISTDILMLCVRELVSKRNLKVVILTSEDSEKISKYFNDCAIYKIPNESIEAQPVAEIYLEDLLQIEDLYYSKAQLAEIHQNIDIKQSPSIGQHLADTFNKQCGNVGDLDLISKLVNHLHRNSEDLSSILVFLSDYNEILLLANKLFNILDSNCEIVPLHNQMHSNEIRKVFVTMSMRKIILTTKIAESLITIDDVKYVIDTGKEKVQQFDSKNYISTWNEDWISKLSAIQRKTRVTSSGNGNAAIYRLYTRECFECFVAVSEPKILSYDVTKVCLLSKLIAKSESIDDFLFKAISPPCHEIIQKHVEFLQQVGALYPDLSITPLGKLLLDIPLNISHAKMLIYGIFFKCVDPILTICSILSFDDPFKTTSKNGIDSVEISKIKKRFEDGSQSDVFVLLRLFQKWNEYKSAKTFDDHFCEKYLANSGTLALIELKRVRLVGNLRALKLIPSVGNLGSLNEQSNNWSVIKACIAAGAYPNVVQIEKEIRVKTEKVVIHPESALLTYNFETLPSNWLVYKDMTSGDNNQVKNCTLVSAFCLAMVAGHGVDFKMEKLMNSQEENYSIEVDDFIQMSGSEATAKSLSIIRDYLNNVFDRFLTDYENWNLQGNDFVVHECVITILKLEDDIAGFKVNFEGLSARPRVITRDFDTPTNSHNSATPNTNALKSIERNISNLRL